MTEVQVADSGRISLMAEMAADPLFTSAAEEGLVGIATAVGAMVRDGPAELCISLTTEMAQAAHDYLVGKPIAPTPLRPGQRLPYLWVDYPSLSKTQVPGVYPTSDDEALVSPSRVGVATMHGTKGFWPPLDELVRKDAKRAGRRPVEYLTGFVYYDLPSPHTEYAILLAAVIMVGYDRKGLDAGNGWSVLGPNTGRVGEQVVSQGAPGPVLLSALGLWTWAWKSGVCGP